MNLLDAGLPQANLRKMQYLQRAMKQSTVKRGVPILPVMSVDHWFGEKVRALDTNAFSSPC